jgi:ABC-type glycerol-3-phosphate transport system permease component
MLPLSKTALVTLGLNIFLQQWDSFLVPVTFISSETKMLLQVAVNYIYSGLYFNDMGVLFAGMAVASAPIIILFLFLQNYYVAGITSTGIKG